MTSAHVVETSVTTTDNSPSQDYTHPNDQTTLFHLFCYKFDMCSAVVNICNPLLFLVVIWRYQNYLWDIINGWLHLNGLIRRVVDDCQRKIFLNLQQSTIKIAVKFSIMGCNFRLALFFCVQWCIFGICSNILICGSIFSFAVIYLSAVLILICMRDPFGPPYLQFRIIFFCR